MTRIKKIIITTLLNSALIFSFAGFTAQQPVKAEVNNNEVKIQYLGNSGFVFSDKKKTKIGIDFFNKGAFPYSEDTPLEPGVTEKDNLTELLISHFYHADHNYIPYDMKVIQGVKDCGDDAYPYVIEDPEVDKIRDTIIGRYESYHYAGSLKYGVTDNAVFKITMNQVKMVHMGDCFGTMSSEEALKDLKQKLGDIDILFVPIGTPSCTKVDQKTLDTVLKIMDAKVVVPMHYWKVADKKEFLANMQKENYIVESTDRNYMIVNQNDFKKTDKKIIWNMDPDKYSE